MNPISSAPAFKEPTFIEIKKSKIKEIFYQCISNLLLDNSVTHSRIFRARAFHEQENANLSKKYAFARDKVLGPSRNIAQVEIIRSHADYKASLALLKDCQNLPKATKAKR